MDKKYYCASCKNFTSTPLKKGNGWIELILYIFYIIPGIIYSIWRRSGEPSVCPTCKADALIPASMAKIEEDISNREERICPYCAEIVLIDAQICKHCKSNISLTEDEKREVREPLTSLLDASIYKKRNYDHSEPAYNYYNEFAKEHPKLLMAIFILGLILFANIIVN